MIRRFIEGDVILNEQAINPNLSLNAQTVDLNMVENVGVSLRGKL